jgi:hypothetical protein
MYCHQQTLRGFVRGLFLFSVLCSKGAAGNLFFILKRCAACAFKPKHLTPAASTRAVLCFYLRLHCFSL